MPGVAPTGKTLRGIWRAEVVGDHVIALVWSPNGKMLAAASISGPVFILDGKTGVVLHELSGHGFGTTALSWNPSSTLLASAGQDGHARLWDAISGTEVAALRAGSSWVECIAFSPTTDVVITGAGKKLCAWNTNGELLRQYTDFSSTIADVKWSQKGDTVAIAHYGGTSLYTPYTAEAPRKFEWQGSTLKLAWSPDGKYIATGDQDSTVHFWITATGADLRMWGYQTKVLELSWDARSRFLATGGGEQVIVWDCAGKGPENTRPLMLQGHNALIKTLAFQPQGPLLASGGLDGQVFVWHPKKGERALASSVFAAGIAQVAWSPVDDRLAIGDENGLVVVAGIPA